MKENMMENSGNNSLENTNEVVEKKKKRSLIPPKLKASFLASLIAFKSFAGGVENGNTGESMSGDEEVHKISEMSITPIGFSKASFNFEDYFEVDNAEIEPENIEKIKSDFVDMLGKITPENFEDIAGASWTIKVSCDERKTSNYEGSNTNLALERAESLKEPIQEVLAGYDFSKSGLSSEQIQKLKNHKFRTKLPEFEGWERGVTPISEMINEATGEKYGDDIAKLSKEDKEKLYDLARYVDLTFELTNEKQAIFEYYFQEIISKYDNATFLIDNSASMKDSKLELIKTIKRHADGVKEFTVGLFAEHLEFIEKNAEDFSIIQKAPMSTYVDEDVSKSFDQYIEYQKKADLKDETRKADGPIIMITDEGFNYYKLQKLSESVANQGREFAFAYIDDARHTAHLFSIDTLVKEIYEEKIAPLITQMNELEKELSEATDPTEIATLKKRIEARKVALHNIQGKNMLTDHEFVDGVGQQIVAQGSLYNKSSK